MDTRVVAADDIGPGAVVNGVVSDGLQLNTWFEASGHSLLLAPGAVVSAGDEVAKAQVILHHLPRFQNSDDRRQKTPVWTFEQVAQAVLLQELADAKRLPDAALQGLADVSGSVVAGPALDTWFAAHRGDPLPGGAGSTFGDEVSRIVAVLGAP